MTDRQCALGAFCTAIVTLLLGYGWLAVLPFAVGVLDLLVAES